MDTKEQILKQAEIVKKHISNRNLKNVDGPYWVKMEDVRSTLEDETSGFGRYKSLSQEDMNEALKFANNNKILGMWEFTVRSTEMCCGSRKYFMMIGYLRTLLVSISNGHWTMSGEDYISGSSYISYL